jgi:predicted Fe-Mo cluster-binding NifX family protein
MKIAITSRGDSLDSAMDPRFGRCAYFVILDTEAGSVLKAIPNDAATAGGGAGVQAAQTVIDEDVEAVVSGNFGPRAFDALSSGGIKLYTVKAETLKEALESFNKGEAELLASASAAAHAGLKEI